MSLKSLIEHLRDAPVDGSTLPGLRRSVLREAPHWRSMWREILLDLPFDESSFDDRFGDGAWRRTVTNLNGVCDMLPLRTGGRNDADVSALSFLGLLLVTLNGLGESSHRRSHQAAAAAAADQPPPAATHDCPRTCQRLVRDEAVAALVAQIYRPDRPADERTRARAREQPHGADAEPGRVWREDIEGNEFTFHRHGTTSIILRGTGREKDGAQRAFALKLILYPFLRISRIEQATLSYKHVGPKATAEDVHLTRVWASASSWILMDYVEGTPLGELLPGATAAGPQRVDLAALRRYGLAVFAALCQFDERINQDNDAVRRVHGDLSPSNIIISGDERAPEAHLIDIGRNYLYAHSSVAGTEGPDGAYIAPEVKSGATDDNPDADLFSLGHLLILVGGVGTRQDRTVPDEFYARVPMIARFIEDLIEHDPANRLLLFPVVESPTRRRYEILRERFLVELDAAQAAEDSNRAPTDDRWALGLLAQLRHRLPEALRPLGGMPGRLRRIRRSLRNNPETGSAPAAASGSLLFWSWLSATAWAVTVSVTLTWFLRQLSYRGSPWQWGTRSVEAYQKALDPRHDQMLPVIDSLRRADYSIPDLAHNWPALLVGFTYILVGTKYYQNLFSSVTPLRVGWRAGRLTAWAASAQFFMRLEAVAAGLLVLPVVLIEPRWWPIDSAIGQLLVYLCNRCVLTFSLTALDRARTANVTSVPGSDTAVTGVSAFSEWVPTSLFYAGVVTVIGSLIYLGKLHDEWVYALAVSSLNFFLFYIIKCGKGAAEVRVLLTRAAFAGERLRRMADKRRTPEPAGATNSTRCPNPIDSELCLIPRRSGPVKRLIP